VPWQVRPVVAWLVVATVLCLASLPALLGDWVYDDHAAATHPLAQHVSDAWLTFTRTSRDYMPDVLNSAGGVWYRPLPGAVSIAVKTLISRTPFTQHALSLAVYLGSMALLCYAYAGAWLRPVALSRVLLPCLLMLHPANCEIYMWLGGLNDVSAGAALLGVFLLLRRRLYGAPSQARPLQDGTSLTLVLLCGMLSKEPFYVAALCLIAAHLVCDRGARADEPSFMERARRLLPALAAYAVSTALSLTFRALATGPVAARGASDMLLDFRILARIPRVLALGVETLLIPLPRPVRQLSWELAQPWSLASIAGLAVALGLSAWALRVGYHRTLALLIAAAGSIAPAVIVADFFWLGFDRYVFIPALLVLMALSPAGVREPQAGATSGVLPRWLLAGSVALSAWLVYCDHTIAGVFHNDDAFAAGMITARPDDPTGYLIAIGNTPAGRLGDAQRAYLQTQAQRELPSPIAHEVAVLAYKHGLYREAASTLEAAYARDAHNPWMQFALLELRGAQHRFDDALQLARALFANASMCHSTRAKLQEWLDAPSLPADVRLAVQQRLAAQPCP
jgi:hypothetical protein